jgi:class 3 adenylate cyclase/tetratricopeptide (TPR) repeat protein
MDCPKCGFANPESHKFCGECGAPLVRAQSEAERRWLTVMFCDLAGSTALSERFDPEDYHNILTAYQACCRAAIGRYDGYIAKYMGDGLLVYFGYPSAHEDDARRAVWAALEIVKAVPGLEVLPDDRLAARIGIATGEVVVGEIIGEGASEERSVLGVTPNLAARLQGVAGENEIVVSEATHRRLDDRFSARDLGNISLKGISSPSRAWRIDEAAETRREVGQAVPFVGREEALAGLEAALAQARTGRLGIVQVTGLPGIGKTRLVTEFLSRHGECAATVWNCSAFRSNLPLHPVPADLTAIESATPKAGEAQRRAVFDAVTGRLAARAASAPLMLVVEDAQWIDPTTAELLETFRRRLAEHAILVVVTGRPCEALDKLAEATGGKRLELEALAEAEALAFVEAAADGGIPAATRQDIIDRAGGLPLFLEELIRVVAGGEAAEVPASLQESLLARLDSLGPAKRVAQLAAVVGRTFGQADLLAIPEATDIPVAAALDDLLAAGLLVEAEEGYAFRHALMQEVAYETLLRSTRRRVHGGIADRLAAEGGDADPELVARHLSGAERHGEATPYWCAAARRSAGLWAHAEAVTCYESALQQVSAPSDPSWELTVRLDLVESLRILDRYDQALAQLDRAEALAERVGRDADWLRLHLLRGNILFPLGEAERCIASHEAARATARRMADPQAEARALSGIADAHFAGGRLATAERAYDACVTLADTHGITAVTLANVSLRGHMRLYLCRIEAAEADCRRAVEMSLAAGNRRAEMTARGSCLGKVLLEAGDFAAANSAFAEAEQLASELGAHRFEALNLLFQGKVALDRGARAEAMDLGGRAVAIAREFGSRFCLPMAIGVVARAEETPEACRAALDEGEALIAAGCLVHNPLWFYRDAALAAARHGWPDEARRYGQALRQAFAAEPLPWCDLVAEGAEALAAHLETGERAPVKAVVARARDLGFMGWAGVLGKAGNITI